MQVKKKNPDMPIEVLGSQETSVLMHPLPGYCGAASNGRRCVKRLTNNELHNPREQEKRNKRMNWKLL